MYKPIAYHIRGLTPLMLHNGQLADPLNPYTKRLREFTSKRKKTDADHQSVYDAEWEGSLYLNEKRQVIIPGENIEAAMIEGGKKFKLGEQCKAGILSDDKWPLHYEGPKDIDKLRTDLRFRDLRGVRVQASRVIRCRPIFMPWSLKFTVHYLPDVLNEKQVTDILETVGRIIGIGDFTPKYGRFEVLS